MTLDDARTIARSWSASAGQSREACRVLLAELERLERRARPAPARVLCAHADVGGRGAHWLAAGEVCDMARTVRL
jgi:hypothetical protein